MRSKSPIKIILEIPFPIDDYDDNDVFYLSSCLNKDNVLNCKNLPIVCINSSDEKWESKIIGVQETLELDQSKTKLIVKGYLFAGGTAEKVELENKKVKNLTFTEIGIDIK